jgi:hypothetical protein
VTHLAPQPHDDAEPYPKQGAPKIRRDAVVDGLSQERGNEWTELAMRNKKNKGCVRNDFEGVFPQIKF